MRARWAIQLTLTVAVLSVNAGAFARSDVVDVAGPEGVMRAAPQKPNGSGIRVMFRVEGAPAAGMPAIVTITLSGVTDATGGEVWFTADPGLALDASAAAVRVDAGKSATLKITVAPTTAATGHLNVFTRQHGAVSATSILVQKGPEANPPKAPGLVETPAGEKILSMPVK